MARSYTVAERNRSVLGTVDRDQEPDGMPYPGQFLLTLCDHILCLVAAFAWLIGFKRELDCVECGEERSLTSTRRPLIGLYNLTCAMYPKRGV